MVELAFPTKPRVSRRRDESIAVEHGPPVYSPKIGEDWRDARSDVPNLVLILAPCARPELRVSETRAYYQPTIRV